MKSFIAKMINELRMSWKNYVFQSLFAAFVTFIVLLFLNLQDVVIIASIGSTAFIVFALPNSPAAKSRNIIGGYAVGLIGGSLCALIPHPSFLQSIIIYSLAVGLSIFIMVITDTEHPPASGVALGVVIRGFSADVTIAVVTSAIILSLTHHYFKKYLKDLR
jgi:CBS-domain-containing membrane protein